MKKTAILIVLILFITASLAACAKDAPTESDIPSPRPAESEIPEETVPASLPQLDGITAEDIAYISRFNDSQNPDGPTDVFAGDREVSEIFSTLQDLHPLEEVGLEDEVPGGFAQYELHLFDGRTIIIAFHVNTVMIGETYYSYETPRILPERQVLLITEQDSYPLDAETVSYIAFNNTDRELAIQHIPRLERLTADGWEQIEFGDIGFCGTPDPFPTTRVGGSFDLSWFEGISAGTYRLSLYYFDSGEELLISTIFELA